MRTVRTREERHLQEEKKKIMVFRTKLDEKILVQKKKLKSKLKLIMMKVGSGGDGDEGDEMRWW